MSKPGSFLKRERCGWECRGPVFMGHCGSPSAGHGHPYCPAECGDGLHGKRTDCGVAHDATRGAAGISVRGPSLSGRTVVKCGVCHLKTTGSGVCNGSAGYTAAWTSEDAVEGCDWVPGC